MEIPNNEISYKLASSIENLDDLSQMIELKECKICLSDYNQNLMISPCDCNGSLKYVHINCLEYYHFTPNTNNSICEICGFRYLQKTEFNKELIYKLLGIYFIIFLNNVLSTMILFECEFIYFIMIGLYLIMFNIIFELKKCYQVNIDSYLPEKYNLTESNYIVLLNNYKSHLITSYIFVILFKFLEVICLIYSQISKKFYKLFYIFVSLLFFIYISYFIISKSVYTVVVNRNN